MTAWDMDPGKWEIIQGIDSDGDDIIDGKTEKSTMELERTGNIKFTFDPKATTIIQLKLKSKAMDYWKRPDLGIGDDDVKVSGSRVTVTVHSLGSIDAPPSTIALMDGNGKQLATASVSALKAPVDLKPKTTDITFDIPGGTNLKGCKVIIDPEKKLTEITRINNTVIIQ